MGRLRFDYFLAGLLSAVGLASFVGATGHSWTGAAALAALSLTDVLLAGVGLLGAAMAGVAGVLVVADARADVAAAHAWQDINAELTEVGSVTTTAPVIRFDTRYIASPQDERLRRTLLAHLFDVPVPSLSDSASAAPPRADAVATGEVDGARSGTELLTTARRVAADRQSGRIAEPPNTGPDCPPLSIAGNVGDRGSHCQRTAKRQVSKALLVANAGVWWQNPNRPLGDARRAPAGACATNVFVLVDRSSRDGNPAHRDVSADPRTTAQPGCRGPPVGVSQQQVSSRPVTIGKSFREKHQSRANASVDPAVVDNLGDRIPVCAAELEVVEAYLDDVLGGLLATLADGQDHRES